MDKATTPTTTAVLTELSDDNLSAVKVNIKLLRQVVLGMQANQHRSTASTLRRGEVRGGGKKPWRQKGTGRARVGSSRTPLWRGGGITFGPTTAKNYQQTLTTRMKSAALSSALALKSSKGQLLVGNLDTKILKTKDAVKALADSRLPGSLVVVTEPGLKRALANIANIAIVTPNNLNALDISSSRNVIFLNDSFAAVKDKLK
jgi:large subunit ribosomal protein L4